MSNIIELARQAGATGGTVFIFYPADLERFAELIRADEREPLSDARINEISTFVYLHNKGSDAQFARAIEQEVRGR